jgi:hypothetical protein
VGAFSWEMLGFQASKYISPAIALGVGQWVEGIILAVAAPLCIEAEHVGEPARRLDLGKPVEEGDKRDHIVSVRVRGEVGPAASAQTDFE